MITIPIQKKVSPLLPFLEMFAPVYFIIIASLRCYIESHILSPESFFSYYLLSHHVLWFITSILVVILFLHLYLKQSVVSLFWLFYGGSIIFIPILYAYLFNVPMRLEYFSGTFMEIAGYSLTAAYKFTRNRPQFWAIIILDIGIFITGYLYTKSFKKAFITLIGTHFILTVIGTKWFGKYSHTTAVFKINTNFSGQIYMSLIWLQTSTILSLILIFFENRSKFKMASVIIYISTGSFAWLIYTITVYKLGMFRNFFDAATPGILIFTLVLCTFVNIENKKSQISKGINASFFIILAIQGYVIIPLFL